MTTDEIIQIILVAIGGQTLVLGALFAWLGKVWADRLQANTQAAHQRELEALRADHSERKEVLAALLKAGPGGYSISQQRVLAAIEVVWKQAVRLRGWADAHSGIFNEVDPQDYEKEVRENRDHWIPDLREEANLAQAKEALTDTEDERPWVGEHLWALASLHRTVALRTVGQVQGELMWTKPGRNDHLFGAPDSSFRQALETALGASEVQMLVDQGPKGAPSRLLDALEAKMLAHIGDWISGRHAIKATVEDQG